MTNAQPEDNIELWGRGGWQQYSKDLISSSIYSKSGPLQRALDSDSVWCEFWCALQVSDTVGAVWCSSSYRSCTAPRSSTAAVKFLTAELRAKLRKKILTSKKVQTGVHHIIYLGIPRYGLPSQGSKRNRSGSLPGCLLDGIKGSEGTVWPMQTRSNKYDMNRF
jgi:hypothetical protein